MIVSYDTIMCKEKMIKGHKIGQSAPIRIPFHSVKMPELLSSEWTLFCKLPVQVSALPNGEGIW